MHLPVFPSPAVAPVALFAAALLLAACGRSDSGEEPVAAGIGNACCSEEKPEVWLRLQHGEEPACPVNLLSPLLIVLGEGRLDDLRTNSRAGLEGWRCDTAEAESPTCDMVYADVTISEIDSAAVHGTYQLHDSTGTKIGSAVRFRAAKCHEES